MLLRDAVEDLMDEQHNNDRSPTVVRKSAPGYLSLFESDYFRKMESIIWQQQR